MPKGHDGPHQEQFERGEGKQQVTITWSLDEREFDEEEDDIEEEDEEEEDEEEENLDDDDEDYDDDECSGKTHGRIRSCLSRA